MNESTKALDRLQTWFVSQCNDDWEHGLGVRIESLDNPGWTIRIAVWETPLESKPFERLERERTEDDWIHAWRDTEMWQGACGPLNLAEMLELFLDWAES